MICISSSNQNLWMERLGVLKEQIQYWMDNSSDKMVEIVQLFYDANM
jgi:Holliday junction resolvasome RuvABC endonuclease subunit